MHPGDLFDLHGKTVVITGGAGYLGSAMSDALASYGADLFILGRNVKKNKDKAEELKDKYAGSVCESYPFDISDIEVVKDTFKLIHKRTGRIDILINNAYFAGPAQKFEDYTVEAWNEGIDGTINSVFKVTQMAMKYMLEQKSGNIINIASMYGMVSPDMSIYGDSGENNPANYGAGKAAVVQLTKYLACVYGDQGIRANAVSPGPFPDKEVQQMEWFIHNLEKKVPMKRIGKPEDLKGIVVFLASDASRYVNGQNIAVDGGWTAW